MNRQGGGDRVEVIINNFLSIVAIIILFIGNRTLHVYWTWWTLASHVIGYRKLPRFKWPPPKGRGSQSGNNRRSYLLSCLQLLIIVGTKNLLLLTVYFWRKRAGRGKGKARLSDRYLKISF